MFKKQDTYSYKGWLNSDFILKRAFAIMGHYMLATLVIYAIFLCLFFVIIVIVMLVGIMISLMA